MRAIIVVPHHLPTLDFLNEWKSEIEDPKAEVTVIIVEDKPERVSTVPTWLSTKKKTCIIYTHKDIDKELGKDSWIIPRSTSAIRSFGLYKAWQLKPDMIYTVDNDCVPEQGSQTLMTHWKQLETPGTLNWVPSIPGNFFPDDKLLPRGFPYLVRNKSKVFLNHGLWSNIPDLDAVGMLMYSELRSREILHSESVVIPRYNFYPMCGMNLAFRPEITPLLYFGLFGPSYGFDQYDDIWAGVFSKKIMDHLGWAVRSGCPSVRHKKQSNAFLNFRKQSGGLEWNEYIWESVQKVELSEKTVVKLYRQLIEDVELPQDEYFLKMRTATKIWLDLFKKL